MQVNFTGCLNLKGFVMSMYSYWLMSIRHIAMLSYLFFSLVFISMFNSSMQHGLKEMGIPGTHPFYWGETGPWAEKPVKLTRILHAKCAWNTRKIRVKYVLKSPILGISG